MLRITSQVLWNILMWGALVLSSYRLMVAADANEPASAEHVLTATVIIVLVLGVFREHPKPRDKEG
ncbi:MAG: hypothetical protein AAGI03_15560 [Pseudomonadota bacterium]